ncbi:unnamed protein product [Cuscuta epithymum]|uniref:Uncharacterized protein n=1 Tax=Cuscuta epithymum TaxID=186058 RepID=A0AAV0G2U6_9ASTE|nr:unnamed protein product [Cuscuta epithymum]CAH9141909.1 unnamed protein product [Cuscuta epithymum]
MIYVCVSIYTYVVFKYQLGMDTEFSRKNKAKLRKKRERMDGRCDEFLENLEKKVVKMWKEGAYEPLRAVIKGRDWGFPMYEKIGRRVLQLLTEAAYVQPPPRPAFALDIKSLRYPYNNFVEFDSLLAQ